MCIIDTNTYIHPSTQYTFTIFPFPRIQPGKFSSDSFYCEYSESVIYLRFVIEHCGALRTLAVIPSSELDSLVWLISSSILAQLYSYIYVYHEYQYQPIHFVSNSIRTDMELPLTNPKYKTT